MHFGPRLRTVQLFIALLGSAFWLAAGCGGTSDESTDSTEIRGDEEITAGPRTCKRKGKHACPAVCGDGLCDASESCSTCATDCGECPPPPVCGDGICDATEACDTCDADCGACPPPPPACGDGTCDATETCDTCPDDCGACAPTCAPQQAPNGDGNHNPGTNCAACHDSLQNRRWTVSGTLYDALNSTRPVAGATIRVVDARGQALDLITAQNGNFWTTQTVTFPLMVEASLCPDTLPMSSPVTTGSCNTCHSAGFRIHVP